MQELEKILKEIDETIERYGENPYIDEKVTDLCYGMNIAKGIIRKHMAGGWIPAKEKPAEDEFYVATMSGALVDQEEPFVWLAEFEDGEWVDGDDVIAWRPLPEPYRPERSNNHDREGSNIKN